MASPYRRVILKLSGEALGLDGKLFCHEKFEQVARMLIDIQHTGVELAVVIGGGQRLARPPRRSHAHGHCGSRQMGMAGTPQTASTCAYAGPSGGARRGDERRGHSPLCRELQHRGRHRAPAGGPHPVFGLRAGQSLLFHRQRGGAARHRAGVRRHFDGQEHRRCLHRRPARGPLCHAHSPASPTPRPPSATCA